MNSPNAPVPASAAPRQRIPSGQPISTRVATAASTSTVHATLSASSQPLLASLPVPKPCTSAIGQLA
jgi:hypothetical protein